MDVMCRGDPASVRVVTAVERCHAAGPFEQLGRRRPGATRASQRGGPLELPRDRLIRTGRRQCEVACLLLGLGREPCQAQVQLAPTGLRGGLVDGRCVERVAKRDPPVSRYSNEVVFLRSAKRLLVDEGGGRLGKSRGDEECVAGLFRKSAEPLRDELTEIVWHRKGVRGG
jgi:hypothetical protein